MNVVYLYECTRPRNSFKIFHFRVDMDSDIYIYNICLLILMARIKLIYLIWVLAG